MPISVKARILTGFAFILLMPVVAAAVRGRLIGDIGA